MTDIKLRYYQEEAVQAVISAIKSGQKNISLSMVIGVGRSIVLAELLNQLSVEGHSILIVVKTLAEKDNLMQCFRKLEIDLDTKHVEISTYFRVGAHQGQLSLGSFSYIFLLDSRNTTFINSLFSGAKATIINFDSELSISADTACPTSPSAKNNPVYTYSYIDAVRDGIKVPLVDSTLYEPAVQGFCHRLMDQLGFESVDDQPLGTSNAIKADLVFRADNHIVGVEYKYGRDKYTQPYSIDLFASRLRRNNSHIPPKDVTLLLIIFSEVAESDKVSVEKKYGVLVWDIGNLLFYTQQNTKLLEELSRISYYPLSEIQAVPSSKFLISANNDTADALAIAENYANELKNELELCETGHRNFVQYEKICGKIINFLFYDAFYTISNQHRTKDHLFRMDLLCSLKDISKNTHVFWKILSQHYGSHFVVFEFKNYSNQIDQNLIYITSKYLFDTTLRNVAIIISRKGFSENACSAASGILKEQKKLILDISDKDLFEMLSKKAAGDNPADTLINRLESFLMGISN